MPLRQNCLARQSGNVPSGWFHCAKDGFGCSACARICASIGNGNRPLGGQRHLARVGAAARPPSLLAPTWASPCAGHKPGGKTRSRPAARDIQPVAAMTKRAQVVSIPRFISKNANNQIRKLPYFMVSQGLSVIQQKKGPTHWTSQSAYSTAGNAEPARKLLKWTSQWVPDPPIFVAVERGVSVNPWRQTARRRRA